MSHLRQLLDPHPQVPVRRYNPQVPSFSYTLVFIGRMYVNMKAQENYPYDSAILGLNGIYQTIGSDSFYINSEFILATDKTITIGKEYIIFNSPTETSLKMLDVTMVDCYYYEGLIHLIVQDIRSQRVFTIDQRLECPENDCTWVLIDINFFIDKMNRKAIQDYCGCSGNNHEKQPMDESKPKAADDLLEFEF